MKTGAGVSETCPAGDRSLGLTLEPDGYERGEEHEGDADLSPRTAF